MSEWTRKKKRWSNMRVWNHPIVEELGDKQVAFFFVRQFQSAHIAADKMDLRAFSSISLRRRVRETMRVREVMREAGSVTEGKPS